LWWGDERCVPPEDELSNFGMAKSSLIDLLAEPPAAVHRMRGELGPDEGAAQYAEELGDTVFDLLLRYAVSEDGALHAEKYYRTVTEEFSATRPAFRWRQLVALARVTASEYGRPAPGMAEARQVLKVQG